VPGDLLVEGHEGFNLLWIEFVIFGIFQDVLGDHGTIMPLAQQFLERFGDGEALAPGLKIFLEVIDFLDPLSQFMGLAGFQFFCVE
jgi:hypothetical protein